MVDFQEIAACGGPWKEARVIGDCLCLLGDCLELLPYLPKVDVVIADPPYGIQENAQRIASRINLAKTIDYGTFTWDLEPASKEAISQTIAAGKYAIIWGGNYFHLPPAQGWLVWDKLNSGDFADCELAWTNLNMAVRIFRHRWNGMIRASENKTPRIHPTQKPIALMRWCIEKAGDPDLILDPFAGSFTTGVAALQLGRSAILIEIEPSYYEIGCQRIKEASRQGKLFVPQPVKQEQKKLW